MNKFYDLLMIDMVFLFVKRRNLILQSQTTSLLDFKQLINQVVIH
jgi:hypothetical protein